MDTHTRRILIVLCCLLFLPGRSIQHQLSSMPSTPRKRPKPHSKSTHSPSSSSSLNALMEPPENFFPSKPELFKLLAVIAIATSVAALCNYVVTILSRHSKPFCDTNADSQYLPSGNSSSFVFFRSLTAFF